MGSIGRLDSMEILTDQRWVLRRAKCQSPRLFSSHPPAHPLKRADVFVRKHTYILYVSIPHCTSCASLHTGGRDSSILCTATRSFYQGATGSAHLRGAVTANNKHPGYSDPTGCLFSQCKGITRKVI